MVVVLGDSDSQEKLSSPLKAEIATEENRKQANLAELNATQPNNRTTYIIPESSHSITEQQRFLIESKGSSVALLNSDEFRKTAGEDRGFESLICKIKLDRKKPFMLGSDKHHICLKGTNINDLYPSYHK